MTPGEMRRLGVVAPQRIMEMTRRNRLNYFNELTWGKPYRKAQRQGLIADLLRQGKSVSWVMYFFDCPRKLVLDSAEKFGIQRKGTEYFKTGVSGEQLAEIELRKHFEDVVLHPKGVTHYDILCNGKRLDVKTSNLHGGRSWDFGLRENQLELDGFVLVAMRDEADPAIFYRKGPVTKPTFRIALQDFDEWVEKYSSHSVIFQ